MARGPAKDKVAVIAPAVAVNSEHDDLVRKRDAFVTSMSMLRNAAEEASRAGLAYFDHIIGAPNGNHQFTTYSRALSVAPPVRATTEEPEGPLKRAPRRKREKRDPGLPKRPMTAYLLFCNQGRDTVKKDLGEGASHKDVIAELTRRWAEVPEDQKKAWQDLYQKNRVVYDKELAEYKASKEPHLEVAAPAAAVTATSSFTAVNHTEPAEESDAESEAEPEATKAVEPEESELSEAEPEEEAEEEEEEEEEDEEEVKSPTPPPPPPSRSKATPRGKKAVNGASASVKKTPIPAPVAATTPATKEKEKRKRTSSRKKAAEEEAVVEESPKKKTKRRRKSTAE